MVTTVEMVFFKGEDGVVLTKGERGVFVYHDIVYDDRLLCQQGVIPNNAVTHLALPQKDDTSM